MSSAGASTRIWPGDASTVTSPRATAPGGFGTKRIYLDAGHGADHNVGNTSAECELEQDFTLVLATDVAASLEATGHFEVTLSRQPNELVDYHTRVRAAAGADAFVSLHSDVRGDNVSDGECPLSLSAPGFSVLWSDADDASLNDARLKLARKTATRMMQAGILPYDGADYRGLYARDDDVAGVFVDRHETDKRIFVLHKPTVPSIIIETHNAWDLREAKRWKQPVVRKAFAAALIAALYDAL